METNDLVKKIKDAESIEDKRIAIEELIELGHPTEPVIEILCEYMKVEDRRLRDVCSRFFHHLEEDGNIVSKMPEEDDYYLGFRVEATEFMRKYYAKEEDNKVFIIEALAKMGIPEAENFLLETLSNEDDFFLQIACIDALALKSKRVDVCYQLLGDIAGYDEIVQPIILKTVNAISFRLGEVIPLDEAYRYIAHNAMLDSDGDIKTSGIISLGEKYIKDDIPFITKALISVSGVCVMQDYIMERLLLNSDIDVLTSAIDAYMLEAMNISLSKDLELIHAINEFSEDMERQKIMIIYNQIIDFVIHKAKGSSIDTIELIISYEREILVNQFTEMIRDENNENLIEVLDVIIQLQISELYGPVTELEGITEETIVEKINQIKEKI